MVELYQGGYSLVRESGVGQAIVHQGNILRAMNVETSDKYQNREGIVHINTIFPDSVVEALRAKRRGQRVVWFVHSTEEDFRNSFPCSNLLAPLFRRWITFCYQLGDVIITPTEYSKKLLRSYGIKKTIYTLSNGVDTDYFIPDRSARINFRESLLLDDSAKIVISAGLPIERKGILDFIETAKKMPDVLFLWYGSIPRFLIRKKVLRAIKTAPDNCCFMRYVPQDEIRTGYQAADAFLFLSHEETEGIVVLEALACQTPVILRDIPVYEGWLQNGESAYKIKSDDEVVACIRKVLDSPSDCAGNVKRRGREVAESRNYKLLGKRLLQIYELEGMCADR
ncbi:MAG: glycosyltransferase [Clostridiales bacterium]|nr:glycosyltransferase [Clostridiales bacterium]